MRKIIGLYLILISTVSTQEFTFIDQTNFYRNLDPETDFYSETGYIKVSSINNDNNQFFYHLFLKEGTMSLNDIKETDNFILWLHGGPGYSSLIQIFQNVGPFHIYKKAENDYSVRKVQNTWNKVAHIIFIDQPFEVGLSYSSPNINVENSEQAAAYIVEFFQIFFQQRQQFSQTNFYIFGVSYSGHYVPAIGVALVKSNLDINFKGIAFGNGWTDAFIQYSSYAPFLYSLGIFSEQKLSYTQEQMAKAQNFILNGEYLKSTYEGFFEIFTILNKFAGQVSSHDFQKYLNEEPTEELYSAFINQYKKQFGAPDEIIYIDWNKKIIKNFEVDISKSQKFNLELLLNLGKKVLIYSGSRDIICNTPSMNYIINKLNWKYIHEWKKQPKQIFKSQREGFDQNETAGTIKHYQNFYFATLFNAGHFAQNDLPIATLKIVTHFLNDDQNWD
ncbi:unnamed protein product [Paramecium octaurelia]|uniref:Serine carboxypeptidase n=1 Tax=Paramecium octaurelia TaxID=43137 RepID=A0A8S1YM43_PAROT|nr:unnamed protein product [Paramecium octaurelia]